jgi:hypothetical protein
MATAQPDIAVYDGRLRLGGFTHKARAHYALANAAGKSLGRAQNIKLAVAAIVEASKAITKH